MTRAFLARITAGFISLFTPLCFIFLSSDLLGQDIDIFMAPRPDDMVMPTYPSRSASRSFEGTVIINLMVDAQGKPFEAVVVSDGTDSRLERAALEALNSSTYIPATLDGETIESSSTLHYNFNIEGGVGPRKSFVNLYEDFYRALNAEEKNENTIQSIFTTLTEYGASNYYENAYINLVKYHHATLYGTSLAQMNYLEAALNFNANVGYFRTYLPEELEQPARRNLFKLQVENNRFHSALFNYDIIERNGDIEAIEMYKSTFEQILATSDDDSSYPINGLLNNHGSWSLTLFKNDFYLDEIQGEINEIKLRCTKKYISFNFDPELDYSIPDTWGTCGMEVVGGNNTSFRLIQY